MSIIIDYKYEPEFLRGTKVLAKNVSATRTGDAKPAEAFSGASVGPTLLVGEQQAPENENDLIKATSALNQDDKKPVAGS